METCNIERCIVYYLKQMLTTPHFYSHSKTDPKPEVLLSKPQPQLNTTPRQPQLMLGLIRI